MDFVERHNGPDAAELEAMLSHIGIESMDELIEQTVPPAIRFEGPLSLPGARSEVEVLADLRDLADQNQVVRSLIGQGYYDTHTPTVILRNILEDPGWYTAYTLSLIHISEPTRPY